MGVPRVVLSPKPASREGPLEEHRDHGEIKNGVRTWKRLDPDSMSPLLLLSDEKSSRASWLLHLITPNLTNSPNWPPALASAPSLLFPNCMSESSVRGDIGRSMVLLQVVL